MQQVVTDNGIIDIFENDIDIYIKLFCEEQKIEDLKRESQSVWNGCLMYVKRHAFNDRSKLKDHTNININNNSIPSTFNRYNYQLVNDICDYYIYLCSVYDKEVSIIGFSNLTGIDTDTINEWGNERVGASSLSTVVYKKLYTGREESLSSKLVTGKQNPVGVLGVLNRHYQWNMPGVSKEHKQVAQKTPEQIAQSYGEVVAELPELPQNLD